MLRVPKSVAAIVACALAVVLFCQPALAKPILQVKVSGASVSSGETKPVSVKTVTISVYDNAGEATSVLINNKKAASVVGQTYSWELKYSLLSGMNTVSVAAEYVYGGAKATENFNFNLVYVTTPVPGLTYEVPSLPPSGKIEAFNRAVTLSYPKDNLLVDDRGQPWTGSSNITFEVVSPSDRPDSYHLLVSPSIPYVLKISVSQGVYLMRPGELTLPYDPQVSALAADCLAIWYSPDNDWDDNDNYILGGYVDARKHTVTAPFQFSGNGEGYYGVFLAQRSFEEFTNPSLPGAWAYSSVMPLWAKGIAEPLPLGRTDNQFGLGTAVNRLEFATMLVKGLGLPLTEKPSSSSEQVFSDKFKSGTVDFYQARPEDIDSTYFGSSYSSAKTPYRIYDANHMAVQYAETAAKNGIVVGYSDGTFGPQDKLTREQAAAVLARVANLKLLDDGEKVKAELEKTFEDASDISPWAAASVLAVYKAKLMVGKPGEGTGKLPRFDPQGQLTRAEALTLTYRLLKRLKKL